jgi:hypothetical protein
MRSGIPSLVAPLELSQRFYKFHHISGEFMAYIVTCRLLPTAVGKF